MAADIFLYFKNIYGKDQLKSVYHKIDVKSLKISKNILKAKTLNAIETAT